MGGGGGGSGLVLNVLGCQRERLRLENYFTTIVRGGEGEREFELKLENFIVQRL